MSSRARDLLERIAQMVIVAKCKCAWQRSKSMTHVNCLRIDTWIVEELIEAVALARMSVNLNSEIDIKFILEKMTHRTTQ
uniref:Uncharacterized protein n=1 Tax=Caenorhabditis tropicalis TaxID=1561998 RepID=A0A1I7TIA7_9PELO